MAAVFDGAVQNDGELKDVRDRHGMATDSPMFPGQRDKVHEEEQKKDNLKVQEWQRKRDGAAQNHPGKISGPRWKLRVPRWKRMQELELCIEVGEWRCGSKNGKVRARGKECGFLSTRMSVHGELGAWAHVRTGRERPLGEGGGGGAARFGHKQMAGGRWLGWREDRGWSARQVLE